ncbi:MAG: helix-turn-helix transcriptional regulator [Clostridia bacterium]|nr:helix-turn-helix transcriptional regulator [Clostridia bacterium]
MFDVQKYHRRITRLRKERNLSQMELADKLDIPFRTLNDWERGNTIPDLSTLLNMEDKFDV